MAAVAPPDNATEAPQRSRDVATIWLPGKPTLPAGVLEIADDTTILTTAEWRAELRERFGLTLSTATLSRYVADGWVVRVRTGPAPNGRGTTGYFERRTLAAAVLHAELRRLGLANQHASWKMDEVAANLAGRGNILEAWERLWPPTPHYTLCEETGRLAQLGACPVHRGTKCLREYAPADAAQLDHQARPPVHHDARHPRHGRRLLAWVLERSFKSQLLAYMGAPAKTLDVSEAHRRARREAAR